MNIIAIVLALIVGGLPLGEESTAHEMNAEGKVCITAERIVKPTRNWKVLKTEIKYQDKLPYLEVSAHNPLNKKAPQSVDAKFVLSIDPAAPSDVQKYNLVMAIYYNEKATVTFKRIYSVREVTVEKGARSKAKIKKFPMQTPCFAREIMPIIRFDTDIVESPTDGGTK